MKITYLQAKYLKHCAAVNNIKVSFQHLGESILIHIRDFEFYTFESALRFLQEDSRMVIRVEVA